MNTAQLENSDVTLLNVHDESTCAGETCVIHNRSDHHMRSWPQHFRDPAMEAATFGMHPGLMERTCPHGVGHPDPDHMDWYARTHTPEETRSESTHGCDGCCVPPARGVHGSVRG